MTQTQIRAAEIVLKKAVPDLSAVDFEGNLNHTGLADALKALRG